MLKHAEIDPETNTVVRVIVSGSKRWCETNLGGVWIRVPKTKVGKGYIYYPDTGKFGPPSPYPSWTLDDQYQWTPPVPHPDGEGSYMWNEETQSWEEMIE